MCPLLWTDNTNFMSESLQQKYGGVELILNLKWHMVENRNMLWIWGCETSADNILTEEVVNVCVEAPLRLSLLWVQSIVSSSHCLAGSLGQLSWSNLLPSIQTITIIVRHWIFIIGPFRIHVLVTWTSNYKSKSLIKITVWKKFLGMFLNHR